MPVARLKRIQEMTWEVNFQLGICEPFVKELVQVPGGNQTQGNSFYPFEGTFDYSSVMPLVIKGEDLTQTSYDMWQRMLDILHCSPGLDDVEGLHDSSDPTGAPSFHQSPGPQLSSSKTHEEEDLPTPPGSSQLDPRQPTKYFPSSRPNSKKPPGKIGRNIPLQIPPVSSQAGPDLPSGIPTESPGLLVQTPPSGNSEPIPPITPNWDNDGQLDKMSGRPPRRTLREFYSSLDMIERTSYVGTQFLEAYAEGLQNDCCSECWFAFNVGDINGPSLSDNRSRFT